MMGHYSDPVFWEAAADRAIRTAAQAALALVGTGAVGLLEVDWAALGSIMGMAALTSVLTSLATPEQITPSGGRHRADLEAPEDPGVGAYE